MIFLMFFWKSDYIASVYFNSFASPCCLSEAVQLQTTNRFGITLNYYTDNWIILYNPDTQKLLSPSPTRNNSSSARKTSWLLQNNCHIVHIFSVFYFVAKQRKIAFRCEWKGREQKEEVARMAEEEVRSAQGPQQVRFYRSYIKIVKLCLLSFGWSFRFPVKSWFHVSNKSSVSAKTSSKSEWGPIWKRPYRMAVLAAAFLFWYHFFYEIVAVMPIGRGLDHQLGLLL